MIKLDQRMEIIKSDQRIELINPNQGMGLITLSRDIKLWDLVRFSIKTNGMKLNHNNQETQSGLGVLYES